MIRVHINNAFAGMGNIPPYVAGLDSASTMIRALGTYLHGKDLPMMGLVPPSVGPLLMALGNMPSFVREWLYTWSGWLDAIPEHQSDIEQIRSETIARWMVNQYPTRRYPAAMIGSPNGAAVHLGAALGIPYLLQTVLMPIRRKVRPDDAQEDLEWGREPAQQILRNNPDLALYQMHDPNQDRLMLSKMGYFRAKQLRLGAVFEQFLRENLEPGATLFVVECEFRWLSTQVADHHYFQFGGTGDLTPEEYYEGNSPRIRDYLRRRRSHRQTWHPPEPDGWRPEAEWGLDPTLRHDVERFARRHGYRVRRIVFNHPEDMSELVADLYRWWYRELQHAVNRLLVESFVYIQPLWTLRMGAVPFWAVFNAKSSVNRIKQYLDSSDPYDEIFLSLFSNSVDATGIASIDEWRSLLQWARKHGQFLGVDERKYPGDVVSFVRYYKDIKKMGGKLPLPDPLTLPQLDTFLAQAGERYPVRWIESPVPDPVP